MARVAFVVTDGFEDRELDQPRTALESAGHQVTFVGPEEGVRLVGKAKRVEVTTDAAIADVGSNKFHALVIPGGHSPEMLREDERFVAFVQAFANERKPIAAICHGGVLLADADIVGGRTVTSWPAVRSDLEAAGATWIDQEVVVDGSLISSRKPADLDAFVAALLTALAD